MIPKIIHYCWFGGKRKTKLVSDCISSWKENLPDYQIIEWNEKNVNLSHPFVKEAYNQKKWAFVSDYIRLQKVEEFGGIYLDTDFVILKKIDELLTLECFFGAENFDYIAGGIFGATQNHKFVKACKENYNGINFSASQHLDQIAIPVIITENFRKMYDFNDTFKGIVTKNDIIIYPPTYFYSFPSKNKKDLLNYRNYIENESLAVHLWAGSWIDHSEFEHIRNREYKKGFYKIWKNLLRGGFNFKSFKKILYALKDSIIKNR